MALQTTKGTRNIPDGGVRLTREEAVLFQKKVITKWKSLSDVIFIQYGWAFSSITTFGSAIYVTNLVRSLLKMGSHARIIPYFMTALPATAGSGIWTETKLTSSTLLMSAECPMCMQLQFGIVQTMFSVTIPAISSLIVLLPLAHKYNTISLPDITYDTRNLYKFSYKLLKSKALQFQIVAALQIPLVFLLPYLQAKQLDKINNILRNKELE